MTTIPLTSCNIGQNHSVIQQVMHKASDIYFNLQFPAICTEYL